MMPSFSSFSFSNFVSKASTVTAAAAAAATATATATVATAAGAVQARRNSYASSKGSSRSSSMSSMRRTALEDMAERFPAELDDYLDRLLHIHNFNFETISQELIASATGFLRHPYADEPEEMLRERAAEVFAPRVLRARWEIRNPEWEVLDGPTSDRFAPPTSHQAEDEEDQDYVVCCLSETDTISTQDEFVDCETASSYRSTPTSGSQAQFEIPGHVLAKMQVPKLKLPAHKAPLWDGMTDELEHALGLMESSDEESDSDDSDSEGEFLQECRQKARSPEGNFSMRSKATDKNVWSTNRHNFRPPARV